MIEIILELVLLLLLLRRGPCISWRLIARQTERMLRNVIGVVFQTDVLLFGRLTFHELIVVVVVIVVVRRVRVFIFIFLLFLNHILCRLLVKRAYIGLVVFIFVFIFVLKNHILLLLVILIDIIFEFFESTHYNFAVFLLLLTLIVVVVVVVGFLAKRGRFHVLILFVGHVLTVVFRLVIHIKFVFIELFLLLFFIMMMRPV